MKEASESHTKVELVIIGSCRMWDARGLTKSLVSVKSVINQKGKLVLLNL